MEYKSEQRELIEQYHQQFVAINKIINEQYQHIQKQHQHIKEQQEIMIEKKHTLEVLGKELDEIRMKLHLSEKSKYEKFLEKYEMLSNIHK